MAIGRQRHIMLKDLSTRVLQIGKDIKTNLCIYSQGNILLDKCAQRERERDIKC